MYLPLAALIVLAAAGVARRLRRSDLPGVRSNQRVALVEMALPAYSYATIKSAAASVPSSQPPVANPQSSSLVTRH